MPFTGSPDAPWYSRIDWQGWGRAIVVLLGLYGIHVSVEPRIPPPVVVQPAPAEKQTLEQVVQRLQELTNEAKK